MLFSLSLSLNLKSKVYFNGIWQLSLHILNYIHLLFGNNFFSSQLTIKFYLSRLWGFSVNSKVFVWLIGVRIILNIKLLVLGKPECMWYFQFLFQDSPMEWRENVLFSIISSLNLFFSAIFCHYFSISAFKGSIFMLFFVHSSFQIQSF